VIQRAVDKIEAAALGQYIEGHIDFPDHTNVGFITKKCKNDVELVVWERGVGLTNACGTGACAAVASLAQAGLIDSGSSIRVNQCGGTLVVQADKVDEGGGAQKWNIRMRGPAKHVLDGYYSLPFGEIL